MMARHQLSDAFHRYFQVVPADSASLRDEAYRIRYMVYAEELNWEPGENFPDRREWDEYDQRSTHCLILHRRSKRFAGCVRLVRADSEHPETPFPFERVGAPWLGPSGESRERARLGEVSRIAVPRQFRRRRGELLSPTGPEPGPRTDYPHENRQHYPFIPLGLFLAAASMGLRLGLRRVYALMEPRLARRLRTVGISFDQVSDIFDYHGPRALFQISRDGLFAHLRPEARELLEVILSDLDKA